MTGPLAMACRFAYLCCGAALMAFTAATPCMAGPTIFSYNDPVGPDETIIVSGDGLRSIKRIVVTKLRNDQRSIDTASESRDAAPVQPTNESVKFIVPKGLSAGVYRFNLVGEDGEASGYLNAPSIYWVQGDSGPAASAGGWIRVLGRNIVRSSEAVLTLLSENNGSVPVYLRPAVASLWDATFNLPVEAMAGTYRLKLWNGEGDAGAISDAGTISIQPAAAVKRALLIATEFGAKGDGRNDDLPSIRAALAEAEKNGGGTVYFPRGRYFLSGMLEVPPNVTLRGEARNLVSLNWPQFDKAPVALLSGFRDFAVKDLTLFAANYRSIISGGFDSANRYRDETPRNIEIDNILIRGSAYRGHLTAQKVMERAGSDTAPGIINAPVTIQLTGINLKIVNSDIYGSGSALLIHHPKGAYVTHNEIYNGRNGWYSITGADGVIFEDNRITGGDIQSSGGGINAFYVASSQNVLFSNNRFSLMHGWDREAMTSDGSGGYYFGPVVNLGASLSLTGPVSKQGASGNNWKGAGVFIVAGRGTGQYAQAVSYENGKVALEKPFKVSPEENSVVTIVPMQKNYLIIGNSFSDTGAAVQFYGTSLHHVVAGNISVRTSGFLNRGLFYEHFHPSWYNQFLNNRIVEGNLYDPGGANIKPAIGTMGISGNVVTPGMPPLTRGIVVRNNVLENNAEIHISGGNIAKTPGLVDLVVESNTIARADRGIVTGHGMLNTVIRNNRLIDIGRPSKDRLSVPR